MSLQQALRELDYPCEYAFKLICQPDSVDTVRLRILESLGDSDRVKNVQQRASRTGKYISLTVLAVVQEAAEVERVYADLQDQPGIVTSL